MAKSTRNTPENRIKFVLRMIKGEDVQTIVDDAQVKPGTLRKWEETFLAGGKTALLQGVSGTQQKMENGIFPGIYPPFLELIRNELESTYAYCEELGRGKNGVACKLQHRLSGSFYCLKTIDMTKKIDEKEQNEARKKLKKEVEILSPLMHRCLPCVYERNLDGPLPYYIESFHPGITFKKFRQHDKKLNKSESIFLVLSLIDAIKTIHEGGRSHCDLHADNIMISDRVFADGILIIDFGSGHRQSASSSQTPDGGKPIFKPAVAMIKHHHSRNRADGQDDFKLYDWRALGFLLLEMTTCLFGDAPYDQFNAYKEFCTHLNDGEIINYESAVTHFNSVTDTAHLINQANRFFVLPDGTQPTIPIPIDGNASVGEATLAVINTNIFQRLRSIKQLSFCDWFFPGGTHTRFEHSLGVLQTMREALSYLVHDRIFRDKFIARNIDGALLAALIHDIGHYPFAHVIEHYVASRYPNDKNLRDKIHHAKHTEYLLRNDTELIEVINHFWGNDIVDEALKILQGKSDALSDLLDGPIDVDKLDYIRRDAHHCGITFGSGLDFEGILQSFACVNNGQELGIKQEGVFAVEGFIVAQNQMLGSVYWHECIRSVMAMFHELIHVLTGAPKVKRENLIEIVNKLKEASNEYTAMNKVFYPMLQSLSKAARDRLTPLFALHQKPQFKDIYHVIAKYNHPDSTSKCPPHGVVDKAVS